jgi:hypothetical protein
LQPAGSSKSDQSELSPFAGHKHTPNQQSAGRNACIEPLHHQPVATVETLQAKNRERKKMKSIKMKYTLVFVIVLALALSACGAKATPTPDIMATANAAASTMIAETQAAMPTDTPIPPTAVSTDTPQPSPTIPPLPTSPILSTPTTVPVTGGSCTGPIERSKGDKAATILWKNTTNQLITIQLHLSANAFGDCGNWSETLAAHQTEMVSTLPLGCYTASAWNQTGKPDWQNLGYPFCTGFNTDKFTLIASVQTIQIIAP